MLFEKQQEIYEQIKDYIIVSAGTSTGKTLMSLFYYFKAHYPNPLLVFTTTAKTKNGDWVRELKVVEDYLGLKCPHYDVAPYTVAYKKEVKDNTFIILDESHMIKNASSQRSQRMYDLIKANNSKFIMLTATPGSKVEEYAHYFMLWGVVKNKKHFENKFLIIKYEKKLRGGSYPKIVGQINKDLYDKIVAENTTDRITVNDIAEMPPLIERFVEFDASSEYKNAKKTRIYKKSDGTIEALDSQPKLCMTLRQLANTKDKIEELKRITEECYESKENLLIFYNFKSELEEIKKAVKVDYIVNGQIKNYPLKPDFDKQERKVTLVQIQAGGTGIELQYNSQVVFFSPTYSYQDYEQAMGRAYRFGQKSKVIVHKFNTLKTIESDVWKSLKNKEDFIERMWDVGKK